MCAKQEELPLPEPKRSLLEDRSVLGRPFECLAKDLLHVTQTCLCIKIQQGRLVKARDLPPMSAQAISLFVNFKSLKLGGV